MFKSNVIYVVYGIVLKYMPTYYLINIAYYINFHIHKMSPLDFTTEHVECVQ